MLIGSGPILLAQAVKAAKVLKASGVGLRVVNLPSLTSGDGDWPHPHLSMFSYPSHQQVSEGNITAHNESASRWQIESQGKRADPDTY